MADKAISELTAAEQIKSTDMFVLEQDGTAKRLQGQVLLNWLTAAADGHGGISDISKTGTSGLVDTYTITLADTTTKTFTVTNGNGLTKFEKLSTEGLVDTYRFTRTDGTYFDFTVTNGNGLTKFEKLSTVGLVDTYRFTRTDGTYFDFTVTNGAKGDKGDNSYIWIKYASQQPTASSHDMGDDPDDWMGIYSGTVDEAPDDWQSYAWFQIKGEKGDTGAPASVESTAVEYMVSDSGTIVPSGSWSTVIPAVPQGKYLWTRVTTSFNTGNPAISYSVARMGLDGTGSVVSVNTQSPDENGNVSLTASQISTEGGNSVQAELNSKQKVLTPGANISISGAVISTQAAPCNPNLLDNPDYAVNQRSITSITAGASYYADRWRKYGNAATGTVARGDVHIVSPGTTTFGWQQRMEADRLVAGLTYTLSFLVKPISIDDLTQIRLSYGGALDTISGSIALPANTPLNAWTVFSYTFTLPESSDGFYNFRARASAVPCEFEIGPGKLELGSVQTLAHQDSSGAWVLNEIPDYAEQLRRCQRYLYVQKANTRVNASGVLTTGKTAIYFGVTVPVPMRALPALLSAPSVVQVRTTAGGNVDPVVSEVSVYAQSSFDAMITLRAATETFNADGYTNNTPVAVFVEDLQLSAEL